MFTIPDKGEGLNDVQSILFQEYIECLVDGIMGINCTLNGLAVTAQVTPDMTVAVAKGGLISNGTMFAVAAANGTITTAHATLPRIDLVVITSAGAIAVRAGTANVNPKPPARTANDVILAAVYVPATDTAINSNQIVDMRVQRGGLATGGGAPILLKKTTSPVTFNTSLAIQTYFTATIPNGLFLTGQVLRCRCGGTYLANSGTPTWTLTITFGGTTMFADVTAATVAGTPRGAWKVEFDIAAVSNTSQVLNGIVAFQTPAAKLAPTTGVGDLSVTTHVIAPIKGTAAVNADAGNSVLNIQWTMSVSNVADETTLDYGTLELI